MAGWTLVPALASLLEEFNQLSPGRDKRSDGTIGDRAHQDRPSDHNPDETGETPYEDADGKNEVHAVDADHTGPWPPRVTMGLMTGEIVRRHRRGLDDRLQNVIYAGRIASRSWGWTWRPYTGSNSHDEHAHFSCRYTTAQENDTRPWGLLARFQPETETYVSMNDDKIKLTKSAADALGGDYTEGKLVSASTLLQLATIYASRANDEAHTNNLAVTALTLRVNQLAAALNAQQPTPDAPEAPKPAPPAPKPAAAKAGTPKPAAGR